MPWFKTNDSHLKNQLLIEKIEMVGLFPGFYLTGMQYETQLVVKLTGHDELHIPTQQENTEKGVFTDFCCIFFFTKI